MRATAQLCRPSPTTPPPITESLNRQQRDACDVVIADSLGASLTADGGDCPLPDAMARRESLRLQRTWRCPGPPSTASVGQSPTSVQTRSWWWFGLEFFVEFVIVAERSFGQIVGVPHPDAEEVASNFTAGDLVDIGPGDLQALVGVLGVQHAVEFANNLHVDLG